MFSARARTRALVAAEMSGASLMTFDTVMTDTPAWAAMSFRRTMRFEDPVRQAKFEFHACAAAPPSGQPRERRDLFDLASYVGPAPIQFAPQGFKKRAPGQVQQANRMAAALD